MVCADTYSIFLQVWWPMDSEFYTGVVTAYHALEHKHTVAYEDGDIEHIQLWAPEQEVSSHTTCIHVQRSLHVRGGSLPCAGTQAHCRL